MLKKLANNIFIFFLLCVLIIVSLEFLLRLYSKIKDIKFTNDNRYSNVIRVYEEGKLFEPFQNFYLYEKNIKEKRFLNFYIDEKKNELIKIWDYNFSTNNYGLVQSKNLDEKKESILFLGDSFTKGTGSEPWLDDFVSKYNELQIINAGLGATGFIQFFNLDNYLSKKLNIKKRVVIYISQDIRRNIILLNNSMCIINHLNCDYKNNPQSIPNDVDFNVEKYLSNKLLKRNKDKEINFRFFIKNLFLYQYLRTSINTLRLKNNDVIRINLESIKKFKNKYKDDIVFIRIRDAGEIMFKKDSFETKVLKKFFKENEIQEHFCDMNNDLSLFHKYDLHPNKKGYEFIQNCVLKIIKDNF